MSARELERIAAEIVGCRSCPRLVEWRERVARDKTVRFADQTYWGRPVPGFGDPAAGILVVGLAPAAHGGNRTGRIFTGDRSGDFLFGSLHRVGLSNQSASVSRDDGLRLTRAYLSAVNRCAPPDNKPTPAERDTCLPFPRTRNRRARAAPRARRARGVRVERGPPCAVHARAPTRPRPRFGHAAEAPVGPFVLLGSYHPSQQNTFTGKLTPPMLDGVLERAAELAG